MRKLPRQRRLRARPLLTLVPNMLTILGLCLGLTALRYGLDARFEPAVMLIILAGVVDGLDGRSARLLGLTSRLGAELDSLVDFVNFGVVPAVLVYLWSLIAMKGIGWPIAILFATCCALRLARFNTEIDATDRPRWTAYFFTGVPAPAAAGLALAPLMLSFHLGDGWLRAPLVNAAFLAIVAVLMVSRLPTFSLKRIKVAPDLVPLLLVGVGLILVFLVTEPWVTLSAMAGLYLLMMPVSWAVARRMRRREEQARAAMDAPSVAAPAPAPAGDRVLTFEGRRPRA